MMFGKCYEEAIKLQNQHNGSKILQVADYKGEVSLRCDPKWKEIPPRFWSHYVILIDGKIHDPTSKQFGHDCLIYTPFQLKESWRKIYEV